MEVSTEHTIVVTGKGQNMPLLTELGSRCAVRLL
jgi:hypothetical protein